MLPLWIIDLTQPSQRRDVFAGLIRGMSHVEVHADAAPAENDNIAFRRDYKGVVSAGDGHRAVVGDSVETNPEEMAAITGCIPRCLSLCRKVMTPWTVPKRFMRFRKE